MAEKKKMTGYPSIDKPWLKYYSEEALKAPLPEATLYQYIWGNNKDYLSEIALEYYGAKISYGKLFENIKNAADAFYSLGVREGDIVTIMSMHTPETIYAIYALNYIGAVANMVYMTLTETEILATLEHTDSKLFLVLDPALDRIEAIKDRLHCPVIVLGISDSMPLHIKLGYTMKARPKAHNLCHWKDFLSRGNNALMATNHAASAIIVYTSGTTGEPKGVVLSNDNINALVYQCSISGKGYRRKETFLNNIPPFFGYGVSMVHLSLSYGIDMTLHLEISPEAIAKGIAKVKPNHYAGGTPILDPLMRTITGDMSWMLNFTGGGDGISPEKEKEINQFLKDRGSPSKYCIGYGMSECVSVACMQQNHVYKSGSVGLPLPLTNIKIVDPETGLELPFGETGEMCFSSPNTMVGYYRNPKETDKIIHTDTDGTRWLHTGDLGYVDSDGYIFYKGRIKRIFVTAGKNGDIINKIFPQRIEDFFENQPDVAKCGVIVVPDKVSINTPIAFLKLKNKKEDIIDATAKFRTAMEEALPDHLWAKEIYILDSMPLTQNGKIDYRALEKIAEEKQSV